MFSHDNGYMLKPKIMLREFHQEWVAGRGGQY